MRRMTGVLQSKLKIMTKYKFKCHKLKNRKILPAIEDYKTFKAIFETKEKLEVGKS